jgi:hypothetical protein
MIFDFTLKASSALQPSKAYAAIYSVFSGTVISGRFLQLLKQRTPIAVSERGRTTDRSDVQLANA